MPTPTTEIDTSLVAFSNTSTINALIEGEKWGGGLGRGVDLTYSFPDSNSFFDTDLFVGYGPVSGDGEPWSSNYSGLNSGQQAYASQALGAWAEVADITFSETVDDSSTVGTIRIAFSGEVDLAGAAAWAYLPFSGPVGGDIWLGPDYEPNDDPAPGTYGYETLLHEIGHALGLKHPFSTSGNGTTLPDDTDTTQYTVMSYTEHPNTAASATTPLLYDIQAIQYLYGANTSTRSGDSTYRFADGEHRAIWDAGGTDLFDLSNFSTGVTVNLTAGSFSSIGDDIFSGAAVDNIAIAYDVTIENAIGGSGSDFIRGNDAVNELYGGGGNDSLLGGNGDDFVQGNAGNDYSQGNAGNDTVRGGADNDTVRGGQGDDFVKGDKGADRVQGDKGDDFVRGGKQDDLVRGGQGNDTLFGDLDNDTIFGDLGNDTLFGGGGADRFVLREGDGADVIKDFNDGEGDRLEIRTGFSSSEDGSGVTLNLDGGGSVFLEGVFGFSDDWLV
ncbi:M10 family metallopeptidase C-terminal domain-containing protein [Rhodovibrionaceae bacterium A322]